MADLEHFTVLRDHLRLIRKMYLDWEDCDFGAPAVDCKRPYGNSSVYSDIAEILDIKPEDGEGDEADFSDRQREEMGGLHHGTLNALQIAIHTGQFREGTYERERYGEWRRSNA